MIAPPRIVARASRSWIAGLGLLALAGLGSGCGGSTAATATAIPPAAVAAPAPAATPRIKPVRWDDVVTDVKRQLDAADAAAAAGRGPDAKAAVYDAYFVSFEALGMETAIRENIASARAFELEEMFADARRRLAENDLAAFRTTTAALLQELAQDARTLESDKVPLPT